METTLLGIALPGVLSELKKLLTSRGFIVQTLPASNPVIVAYKPGNWFRRPRQLVLELHSTDDNMTKVDITASSIKSGSKKPEEINEEGFASSIRNVLNKAIRQTYGFK